ncbi:polymorphic toxin type 50 domain-containing protein [Ligilactobacillus salivarius]|uniref:Polymorphic toxin type 50 domain-containing protein n=1 Tax=Ligilactobacillus salivarius TaxID=1624 RepID=A0ABD7YSP2_9LACO|nr:phage minor capsid protein [Ligilactobacillus salivarius]WHS10362.1 polymorphic toxin type 50 domain-containing protein [Ligilactobacillus salivarius]WHS14298.1 polymorphic toxin type 50 domain-containing protein [Ligilactobacillus salivarius]WHS17087.1 polymorphic toxin type 50 domain-containing protein [Ligilactobacillus salivarius]WHS20284.1 polymorphic toxin type 50 domain-containing protein [Ligilactobacillus salivarius]WHS22444.1 polymorphic toxin type 50 domain-containing protein [Li
MDSKQKLDQDTDNIANLYSNLEDKIFSEIIKVLQRGHYEDVTQDNVVQWQAQQLSQMGALTKRVIDLMADFDGISPSEIETILKKDGYEILDEVSQELKYSDQKSQPISNESFDMLDSMVRQTTDTLNNTINQTLLSRNYSINPVMRTYQEILKRSTIETVTGLKTHDRAVKDAIYQQLDKGIEVMRDKSGRAWSLEGYTRMVLTTTSNRTYNDLRTKRMQEFGQVLCLMSSHPNSREACAYIQGKVVNIVPTDDPNYNDKYDSIYNHGYGEPAGTLGINCRHKLFPFTPGVNINNMTQYNPKEAIRNGNLRQKQRYYERSIRDAKKRLKVAEELEDEQMITHTKTLISARQKKLREYIKETNKMYGKKYDILTRDYAREQVVNKNHDSKEIEILKKRKAINIEKQNKHLKGTKEYNRYREKLSKRGYEQSYITVDIDTLDSLVRKNLDPRKLMRQYQYVDVGIEIGHYKNKGIDVPTTRVKVMQSKTGYHAVPMLPKEML